MADPLREGTADPLREFIDEVAYADAPLGIGGALEKLSVLDFPRVRLFDDCRTLSLTSWLRPRRAADKLNFRPRSSLDSRRFGGMREGPGRTDPLARRADESAGGAAAAALAAGTSLSSIMTMVVALPFRAERPARVICRRSAWEPTGELRVLLVADARPLTRPSRIAVLDGREPLSPLLPLPWPDDMLAGGSSVELRACIDAGREGAGVEAVEMAWTASTEG
jgi:hypothetical protein